MKKYLLPLLLLAAPALAAQQEITAVPDSPVLPSIGALKDAINPKLLDIDENFDELYPAVSGKETALGNPASDGYVLSSTAAGVRSWIEMTGGAGDDLGSAAYTDVVALWTTCTGYLKSDGTCDTPSGSATYPSAAGVANWGGSAWGTSYTVGTAANNLVQLNGSAQLPAVSGALLTNIPLPTWMPSAAPAADNMIIQATGGCSNITYTDQATCEANSGTWTPPVGAWTSINDAGIGLLPSGTENQILQHNGTTWAASSTLSGIGNITGAGSYNNVTITQPATGATLTLAEGSSFITSGGYALTATITGATNATFPAGTVTLLATADVDDTPVDNVTTAPVSSNWAYDHVAAADPHTGYVLESAIGTTVQAYDADLTAWAGITPSTGSLETTGTIQGNVVFNSYTAAQTLTYADHNASIVQMTTADEVTMWDCETAGIGATVMLWARDAEKIEVVPASGDHFVKFDGTALTAGNELDIAATAGTKVTLMCTADDTWSVYSETAASTDGGAAD